MSVFMSSKVSYFSSFHLSLSIRKPFFTDYARITVKADICNPLRYLPDSVKRFPLALFEFHFDNQKHAQHNAFPYTFFLFHLLSSHAISFVTAKTRPRRPVSLQTAGALLRLNTNHATA